MLPVLDKGQRGSKRGLNIESPLSRSIPGVFPESPRWLLLTERSSDMSSFSERRNSSRDVRDDESFTGVSADGTQVLSPAPGLPQNKGSLEYL